MSVRNLAAAGLAAFALGGPLLLIGMSTDGGSLQIAGVAGLWVGLLLILVAMLQLGRIHHRMLRSQARSVRKLGDRLDRLEAKGDEAATDRAPVMLDRITAVERSVQQGLESQRRELLQAIDARIVGIHATVRDLAEGPRS